MRDFHIKDYYLLFLLFISVNIWLKNHEVDRAVDNTGMTTCMVSFSGTWELCLSSNQNSSEFTRYSLINYSWKHTRATKKNTEQNFVKSSLYKDTVKKKDIICIQYVRLPWILSQKLDIFKC